MSEPGSSRRRRNRIILDALIFPNKHCSFIYHHRFRSCNYVTTRIGIYEGVGKRSSYKIMRKLFYVNVETRSDVAMSTWQD